MRNKKYQSGKFSFDFSSLDYTGGGEEEEIEKIPKLNTKPVAYENAEEMIEQIDYNDEYFALVSGSFVFGWFIEALLYKHALKPSAVYITTLGMNEENIDSIVNLCYLKAKKINLIVSHYFFGKERNELARYLQEAIRGYPIDAAVLRSHCKIALILSDKGDTIISGSANLSSSNNVEQFVYSHNPEMISFCKQRLDKIMDKFTVIRGEEESGIDWELFKKAGKMNAWDEIKER